MKQFFNVLYRRILYKIPLKWLLVLLVVLALWFASFSKAWLLYEPQYIENNIWSTRTLIQWNEYIIYRQQNYNCWYCENTSCSRNSSNVIERYKLYIFTWNMYFCCASSISVYKWELSWTQIDCEICENMTSLECQSTYSLIPVSSVDSNYCTTNNLCPSCPSCPSCWTWWISNVYINDILHVGASNIYMNIAEEIDWDYAYTQWWNNMNIDVVWYNVDYEKMQEQIDIQNFKPDSSDLSTIISEIIPLFVPWLCIILLLYFIFRFIKKIF